MTLKPMGPENFKMDIVGEDDPRTDIKKMAKSLDNMVELMSQLHAADELRGASVSFIASAGYDNANGWQAFITATNDIDEHMLARAAVDELSRFIATLANYSKAIETLESALTVDTPHGHIRAALSMLKIGGEE